MAVKGQVGNFTARLRVLPRYVEEHLCLGDGTCARHCPVFIIDKYNEGLCRTKAILIDYPQAIPIAFYVEADACLRLNKEECKLCEGVCQPKAINFDQQAKEIELNVGAVILTTGFDQISKDVLARHGYGISPDVVTGIEFERLISPSGPTKGEIVRRSNGEHPKRIAFLQCIGSRDLSSGNGYCSSVCCMYAIKQALVAKEHSPDLDIAIFYIDIRTQGKDFEKYYNRAKEEYGVRFIRSRVHTICPTPEGTLDIRYVHENGELKEEQFDMVVLAGGLESPADAKSLAEATRIELNHYDFCDTHQLSPLETSRPGIFVAGAFQGPKDISQSITDASGAAALAATVLQEARNTAVEITTYPPEFEIGQTPRIGVFVCSCGDNVGGVVDVQAVAGYAATLDNVVFADVQLYSCAPNALKEIIEKIKDNRLNRVVVAACTPRTHEPLFKETLKKGGLNRCLFEMVNIREHCSWVHAQTPGDSTVKAKDLVRMAVAKASLLAPLQQLSFDIHKTALVVGGGVAGMVAALSLADQGFPVHLVEKTDKLGGNALNLVETWNGEDVGGYVEHLVNRVREHEQITVHLRTRVQNAAGFVGNFETIPTSLEEFELKTTVQHGVTIVATGGREWKPTEYLYGEDERVLTHLDLDVRFKENGDGLKRLKTIVFIQCVGSRESGRPYCSNVCCTHSVKSAIRLRELNPNIDVYILYRDIRTYDFQEDLYKGAREKEVFFIRYSVDRKPQVSNNGDELHVRVYEPILGREVIIPADLIVLAAAILPDEAEEVSRAFKLNQNAEGFFLEAHAKLRPVEFAVEGVYLCGLAHSPKPLSESIVQAMAAAAKASILMAKGFVTVEPIVSSVAQENCIGCGICESLCPFAAIRMTTVEKKRKAEIIAAACSGCGICASHCPTLCISMGGFTNEQILAQIRAYQWS